MSPDGDESHCCVFQSNPAQLLPPKLCPTGVMRPHKRAIDSWAFDQTTNAPRVVNVARQRGDNRDPSHSAPPLRILGLIPQKRGNSIPRPTGFVPPLKVGMHRVGGAQPSKPYPLGSRDRANVVRLPSAAVSGDFQADVRFQPDQILLPWPAVSKLGSRV